MKRYLVYAFFTALIIFLGIGFVKADAMQINKITSLPPVSTSLHVLTPVGSSNKPLQEVDQTLLDFLRIEICHDNGADCANIYEFSSDKVNRGLDYIKLQNKIYHVNWDISKDDIGKMFEINFLIAGLEIDNLTYLPENGRTIPIRFQIENHPRIRARMLHEIGYSAVEIAQALDSEFDLTISAMIQLLLDEQFDLMDIGEVLKDHYGLGPQDTAQLLKDGGYSISVVWDILWNVYGQNYAQIGQIFRNIGYSLQEVYSLLKSKSSWLRLNYLYLIIMGYAQDDVISVMGFDIASKFAPKLKFDQSASTFPMDPQVWWEEMLCGATGGPDTAPSYEACRTHPNGWGNGTISNIWNGTITYSSLNQYGYQIPTYFKVDSCGDLTQLRIEYWWFYSWQPDADYGCGQDHPADWEHIMVTVSISWDDIAAVTFYQHSGHYTKIHGASNTNFERAGGPGTDLYTHPVVYVGKTAHGAYHDDGGTGTCLYYEDWRNPSANTQWSTWTTPLIDLNGNEQSWLAYDRVAGWAWGYDGSDTSVGTHPTQNPDLCSVRACEGKGADGRTHGCWFGKSDCKCGDCWCGDSRCSHDCWSCVAWEEYQNDYWLPHTNSGLIP